MALSPTTNIPRIAITSGEPAGIGPDLVLQLASQTHWAEDVIALADIEMLRARARLLNLPIRLRPYSADQEQEPCKQGELFVLPMPCAAPVTNATLIAELSQSELSPHCLQAQATAIQKFF